MAPGSTSVQSSANEGLCVVYLAWGPLGPDPLHRFLDSYSRHPAGVDHRLIVVLNGVSNGADRKALLSVLDSTKHELLELPAPVLDLLAYRQAAAMLPMSRYCFLNSYSRILAPGWLAHLDRALSEEHVGIAAATGSWASMFSYALFALGLPSAYREVFEGRAATLAQFEQLHIERTGEASIDNPLRRQLAMMLSLLPMLHGFPRFPSHHVRTNAFAIEHDVLMGTSRAALRRKVQTHRLESGRSSFTREVERRGLRAVVVDRFGTVHPPTEWPASKTFWQGEQNGLLVADNQTDYYAEGDARRRLLLSRYAWGTQGAV